MTKPFSLLNEFENEDASPALLKKYQIVSFLKEKIDFEKLSEMAKKIKI